MPSPPEDPHSPAPGPHSPAPDPHSPALARSTGHSYTPLPSAAPILQTHPAHPPTRAPSAGRVKWRSIPIPDADVASTSAAGSASGSASGSAPAPAPAASAASSASSAAATSLPHGSPLPAVRRPPGLLRPPSGPMSGPSVRLRPSPSPPSSSSPSLSLTAPAPAPPPAPVPTSPDLGLGADPQPSVAAAGSGLQRPNKPGPLRMDPRIDARASRLGSEEVLEMQPFSLHSDTTSQHHASPQQRQPHQRQPHQQPQHQHQQQHPQQHQGHSAAKRPGEDDDAEMDPFLYRSYTTANRDELHDQMGIYEGEISGMPDPASESDNDHHVSDDNEHDGHHDSGYAYDHLNLNHVGADNPELNARGRAGWAKVRRAFGIQQAHLVDEESEWDRGLRSVPGAPGDPGNGATNRKHVFSTVRPGVGARLQARQSKYQRRAAALLKAHNLMGQNSMTDLSGAGTGTGSDTDATSVPATTTATPAARPGRNHQHLHRRLTRASGINTDHLRGQEGHEPDEWTTAERLDARPVARGGVLASLLMLYEQQQRELGQLPQSSGGSKESRRRSAGVQRTGTGIRESRRKERGRPGAIVSSPLSEVTSEGDLYGDDPLHPDYPADAQAARQKSTSSQTQAPRVVRRPWSQSSSAFPPYHDPHGPNNGSVPSLPTMAGAHSGAGGVGSGAAGNVLTLSPRTSAADSFHLPVRGKSQRGSLAHFAERGLHALGADVEYLEAFERPEAARNGAGVFGALVASSGNLIGAVSPNHATLGPDPHRAGFKLNRYILPEIDAKTLKQTRKILRDACPPTLSPGNSDFLFPGTPGQSSTLAGGYAPSSEKGHKLGHKRGHGRYASSLTGMSMSNMSMSNMSVSNMSGMSGKSGTKHPTGRTFLGSLLPSRPSTPGDGRPLTATPGVVSPSSTLQPTYTSTSGPSHPSDPAQRTQDQHDQSTSTGSSQLPQQQQQQQQEQQQQQQQQQQQGDYFLYKPASVGRGGAPTTTGSFAMDSEIGSVSAFGAGARGDTTESRRAWRKKIKKRKNKKRERIYITLHVAAILERQDFLLKLSRALMMFGAPTHRIETHLQQTARVLDVNCQVVYLPNLMLVSFGDSLTHTTEVHVVKQATVLNLTKLTDIHSVYWNVIHDKIGVDEASRQLDTLMRAPNLVGGIPMIIVGAMCSALMSVGPMGFHGSLVDALIAAPLGAMLIVAQQFLTSDVLAAGVEIMMACLASFVAAAAYQNGTGVACYGAVAGGAVVLILPGFLFLTAALELQSKAIISGSVHLVHACIYSILLGFGLSIGSALWTLVSSQDMNLPSDMATCGAMQDHPGQPWRGTVSLWWAFLVVPCYSTCLAIRFQAKITRKEFPVMVAIACSGWCVSHFAGTRPSLSSRTDFTAMFGSLTVGLLGSLYGRFFDGRSFVVSVVGMLYQLPSGLSNGGLLLFANSNNNTTTARAFQNGFHVAETLISTAMGLAVGLFGASAVSFMILGGARTRSKGVFSF